MLSYTENPKLNKRIYFPIILFTVVCVFLCHITPVFAADTSAWEEAYRKLELEEIKPVESEKFRCEIDDFKEDLDICSFDVSKDLIVINYITLGCSNLGVYDSKMNLINKLDPDTKSKSCDVLINGNNIVIFSGSQYATEINQNGEFVKMYKINASMPVYDKSLLICKNDIWQNGEHYYTKGETQLIKESKKGKKTILYDCTEAHHRRNVHAAIEYSLWAFMLVVIYAIVYLYKRKYSKNGNYLYNKNGKLCAITSLTKINEKSKCIEDVISSAYDLLEEPYRIIKRKKAKVFLVDDGSNEVMLGRDAEGFEILMDFLYSSNKLEYAYVEKKDDVLLINLNSEEYVVSSNKSLEEIQCPFTDIGGNIWGKTIEGKKVIFVSDHRNEKGTPWEGMCYQVEMEQIGEGIYSCYLSTDTSAYSFADN